MKDRRRMASARDAHQAVRVAKRLAPGRPSDGYCIYCTASLNPIYQAAGGLHGVPSACMDIIG